MLISPHSNRRRFRMAPESPAESPADRLRTDFDGDGAVIGPAAPAAFGMAEAKAIFLGWEKLRVLFNLILAGLCSPLALARGEDIYATPSFWLNCFTGVILVNALFFAGPILESYLDWLGARHRAIRWGLFLLGLLPSMAFAAMSVLIFPEML
ncbi:MAG: hypothetical protein AAF907_11585 [Planctomycetota bacterium]